MSWFPRVLAVLSVIFTVTGCQTVQNVPEEVTVTVISEEVRLRLELVREIKAFEAKLGWSPTDNFLTYSKALEAYSFCAYAGELSFDFEFSSSAKEKCEQEKGMRDMVHYQYEALAGLGTPLSGSLVRAELSRFMYVIFHEDFHEQIRGVPTSALNESATSVVGLLAAGEFVQKKYGKDSDIARTFVRALELSLKDAHIERRYYQELENLYGRVRREELDRVQGLKQKALIFTQLQDECKSIRFTVVTSCSEIRNNAVFFQSIPYAMHYPLFYRLAQSCGMDAKRVGRLVVGVVREDLTEEKFIARIEELIRKGCTTLGAS